MEGLNAILDGWARPPAALCLHAGGGDGLAYMLATVFHETTATMQPVRETLAPSDAEAVLRLERAFAAGRLSSVKTPYWRPDGQGRSWLGRGLVQLTHRRNYQAMSVLTGIDLVSAPRRAMEMDVAVTILIEGMRAGSFTGLKLTDYFSPGRADWTRAKNYQRHGPGRPGGGLRQGFSFGSACDALMRAEARDSQTADCKEVLKEVP